MPVVVQGVAAMVDAGVHSDDARAILADGGAVRVVPHLGVVAVYCSSVGADGPVVA
jgi:hypothetical protein